MKKDAALAFALVFLILASANALYLRTIAPQSVIPQSNAVAPNVIVTISVVPDYHGPGYDAFVITNNATNLPINTPIKFVITNLDSSLNGYYLGKAIIPFEVYNDTDKGVVALNYKFGDNVSLPVAHSLVFSTSDLVMVPIPPSALVTFDYTFTQAGTYTFFCTIPCGPGMGVPGDMVGTLVVT